MADRVSSTMFQICPSFSWMWSKRTTPVVLAIRWPSPNANRSFVWARVNAWCMMWPRQPVSEMTSE